MLIDYPSATPVSNTSPPYEVTHSPPGIHSNTLLFVGSQSVQLGSQLEEQGILLPGQLVCLADQEAVEQWLLHTPAPPALKAVVCDATYSLEELLALKQCFTQWQPLPLVLYNDYNATEYQSKAVAVPSLVEDFLYRDLGFANIKERIYFLSELKKLRRIAAENTSGEPVVKHGFLKRAFDIAVASLCIIAASPLCLLIVIAIKLESRGPVFFTSKRAGAGYTIFDFYKFRSMRSDADRMRNDLKTLNTYYAKDRKDTKNNEPFFFKMKNDPRVTKVGHFLRKTSLDELPQLLNVLKGDMSLVGNRPLPLDEGATLTVDHWADRFLAPAGMTGLWQIAKNKDNMSVSERIELDLAYVANQSFRLDMKILLKTVPAMLQKE